MLSTNISSLENSVDPADFQGHCGATKWVQFEWEEGGHLLSLKNISDIHFDYLYHNPLRMAKNWSFSILSRKWLTSFVSDSEFLVPFSNCKIFTFQLWQCGRNSAHD